jgi:hypothetical protein
LIIVFYFQAAVNDNELLAKAKNAVAKQKVRFSLLGFRCCNRRVVFLGQDRITVALLKAALKAQGLNQGGLKAVLVARLTEAMGRVLDVGDIKRMAGLDIEEDPIEGEEL